MHAVRERLPLGIKLKAADGVVHPGGGPRRAAAPDERPDAHNQLTHGEGFAQVVVAARLEATDHILGRRAGREEEDRHVDRAAAQRPGKGVSVHAGHHDVRDDHVGPAGVEAPQPLGAVVGHRDVEFPFAERVGDDVGQCPLVLDEQHADLIVLHRAESV